MDDSSIVCTSFNFLIHGSLASLKSEKKKKKKNRDRVIITRGKILA